VILSFDKEVADITSALDLHGSAITDKQSLVIAMILAGVLDRGMAIERTRCLDIVARKAMNAAKVREEIVRPVR